MAIDLLQSFLQRGNRITSNQETAVSPSSPLATPANQQILRAIRALQAGQTLQGEILSVKGEQVQLEILKEVIIDARLSGALNLTPGTSMTFQVKSNQGGSLSLMPLFTNVSTDPNVLKALDMAGITVNERTTEMVQLMMEKGMPVGKQSLLEMYREVLSHKESPVGDIISLKQLGMAVSKDNLEQFSLYKNNNHLLTNSFQDMGKALSSQLSSWIQEGKLTEAENLLQKIYQIFHPKEGQSTETSVFGENRTPFLEVLTGEEVKAEEGLKQQMLMEDRQNKFLEGEKGESLQTKVVPGKEGAAGNSGESKGVNPALGKADSLEELSLLMKEGKEPSKLLRLFEKIWEREVKDQWLLRPEEVGEKDKLNKLYENLDRQLKQLEEVVDKQVSSQAAAAKAVHTASSSVDFMNQLNQIHAYVQIPLKMMNQNGAGELYVFTNKRSLQKKEGRITALLHLDMEYLGPLDVHVALENQKVSTQFYLQKEEDLDFLENHMELLTSRLKKRGYDCSVAAKLRQEEETKESIVAKIGAKEGQMLLSTQAFDMRA